MPATRGHRAKLYRLSHNDAWKDHGVGLVKVEHSDATLEGTLVLEGETVNEAGVPNVHLEARISNENPSYHRTASTIITWTTDGVESALSFEDEFGCAEIWRQIYTAQGLSPDDGMSLLVDDSQSLPEVTRENLTVIAAILSASPTGARLAQNLVQEGALVQVFDLFDAMERDKDAEGLVQCFHVCKAVALMYSLSVTEALLSDELFPRFAGVLEYEPNLPLKPEYRAFLHDHVRFKQVVAISDPSVVFMITQRFRLAYMRDVLLARVLDETSFKRLGDLDMRLSYDIALRLHQDDDFMRNLLDVVRSENVLREEATSFLAELSALAQKLSPHQQSEFYRTLAPRGEPGLFDAYERILSSPSSSLKERLNVAELLVLALKHDSALVREHIMLREESQAGSSLLGHLLRRIVHESDAGVQSTCAETLRFLLDPELAEPLETKEKFLGLFYSHYGAAMFDALAAPARTEQQLWSTHIVCELVTYCIMTHGHLAREFLLSTNVAAPVLALAGSRHKHLVLDAIRFVRACVGSIAPGAEFYASFLVNLDAFQPIFDALERNGSRGNLVHSSVLELIERIAKVDNQVLSEYVLERFGPRLRTMPQAAGIVDALENRSLRATPSPLPLHPRAFGESRAERDDDKEAMFDDDDDEEEDDGLFVGSPGSTSPPVAATGERLTPIRIPAAPSLFDDVDGKRLARKRVFASNAGPGVVNAAGSPPEKRRAEVLG